MAFATHLQLQPPQAAVLEDLFQQFPDVPREVVLNVELLSLGHWFTDAALDAGRAVPRDHCVRLLHHGLPQLPALGPQGRECRFCDINENARQMKESHEFTLVAPVKPLEDVREVGLEVSREALATYGYQAPVTFLIKGGTILKTLHGKDEDEFYADYVRALKWAGPRRSVELQTNAKTKGEIKWLHGEGMDKHDANMEVWDQRLFEWINPGKTRRIGHDEWVRRMYDSVDVLGEGNVRPNFVGGIEMARPYGFESVDEAVASTTAGIDEMMAHGVLPRFNQWRREPKSNLVKEQSQPPIPTEFYLKLMRNRYELWKKYGLPMPNYANLVPEKTYMGVDHGIYDDYPLLMEASYYQNLEERDRTPEGLIKRGLGGQDHPLNSSIHGPAK